MNIVLRKAVSDDIPKIEELLLEMLKTIYHTDDPGNFETDYLKAQIERFSGNISRTAEFVGMERSALHRKLKSLKERCSGGK